jgi:hypothetical protein
MFEKVSQAAEQVATGASRREFLGQFGRGAMAAAAALGGVLALPAISAAARKPPATCGSSSYISCVERNTGDPCISALGRSGVCRYDKIDFTPADACECYVKGPKNSSRG